MARSAFEFACNITESESDTDVVSVFTSLTSTLQHICQSRPSAVDGKLSQIELKSTKLEHMTSLVKLLLEKLKIADRKSNPFLMFLNASASSAATSRKMWEYFDQIQTAPRARNPLGIATHPNGDIVLTSDYSHPCGVF